MGDRGTMNRRAAVATALLVVALVALVLYYRSDATKAREAATARRASDCARMLSAISSMRSQLEIGIGNIDSSGLVARHGGAMHFLLPMVAVCTGDEVLASTSAGDFAEARTPQAAAAVLQRIEDRFKAARASFNGALP